jgi:hypothetical protein
MKCGKKRILQLEYDAMWMDDRESSELFKNWLLILSDYHDDAF